MILIDTHCHLDFERFDEDRDQVVARAEAAGVKRIIVPALDPNNAESVLALAEQYEVVYAAVGIHPNSAAGLRGDWVDRVRRLAKHEKVVAIGEIGLDYYWDKTPVPVQHRIFRRQLALAAELELPVIVHNRESDADVIRLLAQSPLARKERPGVLHSFSAPWETAAAGLDLGFYLGFTGPVTFKNAESLRSVAARVPLGRILVETDAPFLTPQPHRGKRNEPSYVAHVANRIATLRSLTPVEFAAITTANATRLFALPPVE